MRQALPLVSRRLPASQLRKFTDLYRSDENAEVRIELVDCALLADVQLHATPVSGDSLLVNLNGTKAVMQFLEESNSGLFNPEEVEHAQRLRDLGFASRGTAFVVTANVGHSWGKYNCCNDMYKLSNAGGTRGNFSIRRSCLKCRGLHNR